jgi:hypothetical protein
MNELVLITFTVLLPMTPAYILYKALPARTTIKGPFKGLNIQLSGAFGGYFLLVLTIIGFITTRPQPLTSRYEVWEVKGRIQWDQDGGPPDPQRLRLSLVPANQTILGDGSFDIQIAPEVVDKGKLKFPKLVIDHPDFQTITIDLNDTQNKYGGVVKKVSMDILSKEIAVDDPIELKKKGQLAPYAPPSQPPDQAAVSSPEHTQ